MNSINCREYL